MGPIRNPNWSTSGMRVTLSYLMYKLRQWRQVVKLYFPKMYIDKVVIIEIKQTCHTIWLHWEDISICFYLF